MSEEAQLIGAIAALWAALTTFVGAALRWLLADRARLIEAYDKRIAELEAKLAGAGVLMQQQNESLSRQIQQQQILITALLDKYGVADE